MSDPRDPAGQDHGRHRPDGGSPQGFPTGAVAFLAGARRAILATEGPDGRPRPVPICFVVGEPGIAGNGGEAGRRGDSRDLSDSRNLDDLGNLGDPPAPVVLYSPLDEKPKRHADPLRLSRIRDVIARPRVAVLVDRWDEDWGRLAWLRLEGLASVLEPDGDPATRREHREAVNLLRAKYPQYADHALEIRPMIRIAVTRAVAWGTLDPEAGRERAEPR